MLLNTWLLKLQIYLLRKPRFRLWATLENLKHDVLTAVEDSEINLPNLIFSYLSTAVFIPVNFEKIYWKDVIESFYKVHGVTSTIRKIPITFNQSESKGDKDPWDYSNRLWPLYMHIIAKAYGWSDTKIAKLSVDNALAYIQEILTDKQLEKEFVWTMAEVAYVYDKSSKKSKFQPLTRPYWMITQKPNKKAPAVPKSLLPVGNIVRISNEIKEKV